MARRIRSTATAPEPPQDAPETPEATDAPPDALGALRAALDARIAREVRRAIKRRDAEWVERIRANYDRDDDTPPEAA
ncbi:MAG: hypothetical protein KC731_10390 [Myxococcales bacterium]|nr:hypothetical protein [Myxococcales bacterium]